MKNYINYIIGITFAIATVWLILLSAPKIKEMYFPSDEIEIKTDTVVRTDTLYLDKLFIDSVPKVKYVTVVKRDTVYGKEGDSLVAYPMVVKKKLYQKTEVVGNDTLTYSAHVTGRSYEDEDYPTLDSISFVLRGFYTKEDKIITNTITKRQKARKWHVGAQAGYGYGVTTKKPDIFVGIGVSYTIW